MVRAIERQLVGWGLHYSIYWLRSCLRLKLAHVITCSMDRAGSSQVFVLATLLRGFCVMQLPPLWALLLIQSGSEEAIVDSLCQGIVLVNFIDRIDVLTMPHLCNLLGWQKGFWPVFSLGVLERWIVSLKCLLVLRQPALCGCAIGVCDLALR